MAESRFIEPLPAASTTIMPRAVALRMASYSACQYSMAMYSNCPQLQEQAKPLYGPLECNSIRMMSPAVSCAAALLIAVGAPLGKMEDTTIETRGAMPLIPWAFSAAAISPRTAVPWLAQVGSV